MTLVVSLLNGHRAIQLSDRRLTNERGPATDEYGKGALVITRDVRMVMGLSGLATLGRIDKIQPFGEHFDLRRTIATALLEEAKPEYLWEPTVGRLATRLAEIFAQPPVNRLSKSLRRCVIHFVGFNGTTDPPSPISTFVSNFHDIHGREFAKDGLWDEFRTSTRRLTGDGLMAQAIGTYTHISQEDMNPLLQLMNDNKPPEAVIGKGVELFREWAGRLGDSGAIGKQVSSIVLPSDMFEPATTNYHFHVPQREIFGLGEIRIDGPRSYANDGFRLVREDGPAIGPKLGRNEPCWCGNSKKFKRCHGSPSGRGQTLTVELQQGKRLPDGGTKWSGGT